MREFCKGNFGVITRKSERFLCKNGDPSSHHRNLLQFRIGMIRASHLCTVFSVKLDHIRGEIDAIAIQGRSHTHRIEWNAEADELPDALSIEPTADHDLDSFIPFTVECIPHEKYKIRTDAPFFRFLGDNRTVPQIRCRVQAHPPEPVFQSRCDFQRRTDTIIIEINECDPVHLLGNRAIEGLRRAHRIAVAGCDQSMWNRSDAGEFHKIPLASVDTPLTPPMNAA